MADITMCTDEECSKRFRCYRFTAPWSDYRQSIFAKSPRENENCSYFWDNGEYKKNEDINI